MSASDSVIRLIFVGDRVDDAEQLISQLRNGGIAVRPQRPETLAALQQALASGGDLVLADLHAKQLPFREVAATVEASGKDIPLLGTVAALREEEFVAAQEVGARGLLLRGRPAQVLRTVRAEFEALRTRRALRRAESALRETERRCDALIDSSREPIAYLHEGMHIRANEAYLEMFGYESFDEVEGLSVLDMIAPTHTDAFKQLLKRLGRGEPPPPSLQLVAQRADGSAFDAVMEFNPASWEGEPCLQVVFRQQALDAEMARELDALRQRDQATGLFNRQHFLAELEHAIVAAAEGKGDQAVLLLAADNHASLLSDIGMANADALLSGIGGRVSEALSSGASVARFSDHGLAVLLTGSDHAASARQAQDLVDAFHGHVIEAGDRSLSLTLSVGGVQIGEKIASIQQVLAKAGQCLQTAHTVGGDRIEFFDPAARDRAEEENIRAWLQRIEDALENDGFVLHYQPIVGLHGQPGERYEVLLRMRAGKSEVVPPMSFLPIAEEHGLLPRIDRWVIGKAIEVLAERTAAGHDTTLFVKVTPASLGEGGLDAFIGEALKQHGVPGQRLVLQLPENKVVTNLKASQEFQKAVGAHGCLLALEQFGSGLNPFQLLGTIEPDVLKIDRSHVEDLAKAPENQKKIREIVDRARQADKQVIAEFVQDAASMSLLFSCGVEFVEGHFLAADSPDMNYDFG